jgi:hypothetical protein
MPRYRMIVRGRNFHLNFHGTYQRVGFHTVRYADGPDAARAVRNALDAFRWSQKYVTMMRGALNSRTDPGVLSAEQVEETSPEARYEAGPPGLVFYREDTAGVQPASAEAGLPGPAAQAG